MSINIKQFKEGDFGKRRNTRDKHPILLFLNKNKERAYSAEEIAKQVKMNKSSVRSMLNTLIKIKAVEHKQPYFISISLLNKKKKK